MVQTDSKTQELDLLRESKFDEPSLSRIIHISDLHFGRTDPFVTKCLIREIEKRNPKRVLISGDLTMRAKRSEFLEARAFIEELKSPALSVPGNHDIPSIDLPRRAVTPFHRFKRYISDLLEPTFEDETMAIYGLNTARRMQWNSLDWSRGRINANQLKRLSQWFKEVPSNKTKLVFAHHPFALPVQSQHRGTVGRFAKATKVFLENGIDALLAGHLHQSLFQQIEEESTSVTDSSIRRKLLVAQASTATSTRLKGEPNSFNELDIGKNGEIKITKHLWMGGRFVPDETFFHRRSDAV